MRTRVTIKPTDSRGAAVRFELVGDDAPAGGVGGWETLARPRRDAAVEWVGTPNATYVLPLLLDGIETRVGKDTVIESDIRQVKSWGQPTKKTGQPPVLRLTGPLHVKPGSRWVLNDIEWGPAIRNKHGRRIQQQLTLSFLKYVEARIVRSPAKRARYGVGHD